MWKSGGFMTKFYPVRQLLTFVLLMAVSSTCFSAEKKEVVAEVAVDPATAKISMVATLFESIGIYVMAASVLAATLFFIWELIKKPSFNLVYLHYREHLAQGVLVGLELIVIASIIQLVVIDPSMNSIAVLGAIILVRTFLSFSLFIERHGCWPWERKNMQKPKADAFDEDDRRR
jgi:uncharacterized membrane protein